MKQWHGALETLIMITRIKFVYLVMIRSFYPFITRVEWSFVWQVGLSSLFFFFFGLFPSFVCYLDNLILYSHFHALEILGIVIGTYRRRNLRID